MAKEGSTIGGLMDVLGTAISIGLAVRRAAGGLRQQVRPQPVRAGRVHQEPGHPDRQEHRRLHLPLAGHGVHPRLSRGQRPQAARPTSPNRRPPTAPVLKVNGHRTATIADLEHAEAVMGAKVQLQSAAQPLGSPKSLSATV